MVTAGTWAPDSVLRVTLFESSSNGGDLVNFLSRTEGRSAVCLQCASKNCPGL